MRITCPSCAAEYDVPGEVAPGRSVRCARCGNKWMPVPPPPAVIEAVAEPAPPEPMPVPSPVPAPPPVPSASRPVPAPRTVLAAWIGSLVLIAALVAAAIVWREPIRHAWPPSGRAYDALGLTERP